VAFDPNAAASPDSGIYGLPHTPDEAQVVLIPVPFEATTSYGGGTSDGPSAILEASRQVDLFDIEVGRPYAVGIAMLDEPALVRGWNDQARALAEPLIAAAGEDQAGVLPKVNALCEQMNVWVLEQSRAWLAKGKVVGVVGGDHSVPFGCIQACAEKWPGLGVLHLDAHADLREAYQGFTWSHASIMFNVMTRIPQVKKLVQVGIRDFGEAEYNFIVASNGRVKTFYDAALKAGQFAGMPWRDEVDNIVRELPQNVYLSFDIDGLDPTLCPHTGTPVPGGLSFAQACALVEGVVRAGKRIVGFDLNEVAPSADGGDWDGNVGARLLYKMIGWTLRSAEKA
jgi:agmatinase